MKSTSVIAGTAVIIMCLATSVMASVIIKIKGPSMPALSNEIKITSDNLGSNGPIFSFQGNCHFDPALMEVDTVIPTSIVLNSGPFAYSVDTSLGVCTFACAGVNPLAGNGIIFTITMARKSTAAVCPYLFNAQILLNEGFPLSEITYDCTEPTSVDRGALQVPGTITLGQNYPNPFNPTTTILYTLDRAMPVMLTVFNLQGAKIRELVNGRQGAGSHEIVWDGNDNAGRKVASGVYYYLLNAGDQSLSRKMLLLK